jgi:hypothetical protein
MSIPQTPSGEKSMEHNSPAEILESQIRECFGRVVWTHKTQEKCADILFWRNSVFKWAQIILSAITTTGILTSLFIDGKWVKVCSAIISFALVCINSYLKQYNLGEIAQRHAEAAVDIWDIRESYFSMLTDLRLDPNVDIGEIKKHRDELQNRLKEVYKCSPRTISKAYTKATKALKECEEMTFSDEEIDKFLPEKLHRTHRSGLYLGVETQASAQPIADSK